MSRIELRSVTVTVPTTPGLAGPPARTTTSGGPARTTARSMPSRGDSPASGTAAPATASHKHLLRDIDLDLPEQRIGVIGANGSGKSTFLKLLNGLVEPSEGNVVVDGLDTVRRGRPVRRKVGFVFTDPLAQLVMPTVVEDVELSLRASIRKGAERRRAADEILARFGLSALADQSIYDLSGGERQLVALATVLAVEPDILVADEPTTLLDLRNRNMIGTVLRDLPQQLVVSTHDLDLAAECDRVLVFDGGTIVCDDSASAAIGFYRWLIEGGDAPDGSKKASCDTRRRTRP